ncbi:DUF3237 family protein [Microdochium nivale]|nr:DUF3237 family protein [Microdochium nivale]
MKLSAPLSALLLSAVSAPLAAAAAALAAQPVPPTLTLLYSMNCTVAPDVAIGQGPIYNRVALPIVGGTFSGPRGLSGTIANLGADWGITDRHGVFHPDTRYHLYTEDKGDGKGSAGIYVQTTGPVQPDGKTHLRIIFETGHPDFYWLNYVVAVGVLRPENGYVLIDAWQINSPVVTN